MFNLPRLRDLARQALDANDPGRLRKIVAQMETILRVEQRDLKLLLAERRLHYPGPPIEP
jgi:hypothetical protein